MTRDVLDRSLVDWLDAQSSTPTYLAEAMARTRGTRQRPAWTFPERWLPMQLTMPRPLQVPRTAGFLVLLALLTLVLVAVALFSVGDRRRLPAPFGLAGNGLLAWDRDGVIYTARPDGSDTRALSLVPGASGPVFSPDGSRLAFYAPVAGRPTLFVARADGTASVAVSSGIELDDLVRETRPSWEPSGTRLVFAGVASDGRRGLYVAQADGSATTAIGSADRWRIDPAWSPDGRWIAFQGYDPAEAVTVGAYRTVAGLYVIRPDGSDETLLAGGQGGSFMYRKPQWQPDPSVQRLATNVGEPSAYDIALVDVATREVHVVRRAGDPDLWPVWSPDGTSLAWSTAYTGTIVARPDGTVIHTLQGIDYDVVWSPDGRYVYGWKAGDPSTAVVAPIDGSASPIEIPTTGEAGSHWSWQRVAP